MQTPLSHGRSADGDLAVAIAAAQERIAQTGYDHAAKQRMLADLDVWAQCEFGQWMLLNGGWDGYWTRYVISYPDRIAAGEPPPDNEVERFFLEQSPGIVATQERFKIFQQAFLEFVGPESVVLEVPCGVMDDLLTLRELAHGASLIGVDIDPASIGLAHQTAIDVGRVEQVTLAEGDAWDLSGCTVRVGNQIEFHRLVDGGCDVLTSNGLNIYVEDDEKVVELYRSFATALKPGGVVIVSALTPQEDWQVDDLSTTALQRARALNLMNGVGWLNLRSVQRTTEQLRQAGLVVEDVRSDARAVFPTYIARKAE